MSEQVVDLGECQLWTGTTGNGFPLLLSNGGPGCCDYLGPVAEMLDEILTVHRWEQRGCGRSSLAGPYDQATCISDIEALRRHFGYERWIVGGHSWGANLALAYAVEHPERVAGMIYLSGTGITEEWKPEYHKGLELRGELTPTFEFPPNLQVNKEGNKSRTEYLRDPEIASRLTRLDFPTLIIHGGDDIRPSWPAREVAELMPRAQYIELNGIEHCLWLQSPKTLRDHLRSFVREALLKP